MCEQWVGGKRYIVCHNEEQARKDAADREAIVESLKEKLKRGDKNLVGNKGYRRHLKSAGSQHFTLNEDKLLEEEKFDRTWVLRTNTPHSASEVTLKYKQLWSCGPWNKFSELPRPSWRPVRFITSATTRFGGTCFTVSLL